MNQADKDPRKLFINSYRTAVLENNWSEERFDTKYLKAIRPIQNVNFYFFELRLDLKRKLRCYFQTDHQYGTTYQDLCKNNAENGEQQWKANTVKSKNFVEYIKFGQFNFIVLI